MLTAIQRQLGTAIRNAIYQDFAIRHVSGNLMNTLEVIFDEDVVKVRVPAVRYDQKEWNKNKAIIPQPQEGSYANEVDISGGYSRTHQSYADRAIGIAISEVMGLLGSDAYSVEVR